MVAGLSYLKKIGSRVIDFVINADNIQIKRKGIGGMKTYYRLCKEDYTIMDKEGISFTIKRGKEYLTSEIIKGIVTVFSQYWVDVPIKIFAKDGVKQFTNTFRLR